MGTLARLWFRFEFGDGQECPSYRLLYLQRHQLWLDVDQDVLKPWGF
ncbi:MAG: hypothetical protein JWN70_4801 [Planctomycetaceae bacterium]|nr:hypothetical protein [Planctomycetaceae bacterium]